MSPTRSEELVLFALMSIWFGNKLAKELIKPSEEVGNVPLYQVRVYIAWVVDYIFCNDTNGNHH